MRIGIDIDDTALDTVTSMIKYADIYDIEYLGRKGITGNLGLIKNRYYLKALYGWDVETKFNFFNTFYKNVLEECVPRDNSVDVINRLRDEGNLIYFISARLTNIDDCNTLEITKDTFNKYGIDYDKLIINASDKLEYIKNNKIDIYIEDSYETVVELLDNGINAILMNTQMNNDIVDDRVKVAYNWDDVYKYIEEISNGSRE